MKRAYSIVRFSSWKQAKGESQRRQREWSAAWADRNHYHLDDSLRQEGKPVSADRGANRIKGALADFLDMVKVGRVAKGSVLLVESLDRLSREEVDEAYELFRGILRSGIDIVTMVPERRYTREALSDVIGLIEPLLVMSRAHEESLVKSERIADVWKKRREVAGADRPMNAVGPAWLRMEGGRWRVVEEKAAVVRRIFRLAIDGYGIQAIAAKLNDKDNPVPPIGRAPRWNISYISLTLRNRAVIGELQPQTKRSRRTPVGKAIPNYYPAIISEAEFYRAQQALASRKNARGPMGRHVRNLFTGLIRDARDGCTLITVSESDKCRTVKLVSSGGMRGEDGSSYLTFPYSVVEEAFLRFVRELKASDVLPSQANDVEDAITTLAGQLQNIEHGIARTTANMKASGEFDLGLRLLRELEDDKAKTTAALEKAKAERATAEAEVLGEAQSIADLLATVEGDELTALRHKLKQRIRELVTEIWLLVVPHGRRRRVAAMQVYFAEGKKRRDYIISYTSGTQYGDARQDAEWWVKSFAGVEVKGDLDLRKRDHAKRLERALAAVTV